MENQHLTQQAFADKIQISPASLSSIFNNRTNPTLAHVNAIRTAFPSINVTWLMYGEGEMFAPANSGNNNAGKPTTTVQQTMIDFDFDSPQPDASTSHVNQERPQPVYQPAERKEVEVVKIVNKPQRQISEIRVFYDDQTWETFVPKR